MLRIAKPVTSQGQQESYTRHHDPERWRFIYDGPAAGSGDGHDIDVLEAVRIAAAFTPRSTPPACTTTPGSTTRQDCATCMTSRTVASIAR